MDTRHKMRKVSEILRDSLPQREVLQTAKAQDIYRNWKEILTEPIASNSHPYRYQKGTLWIQASSSSWAQELQLLKEEILNRLNERSDEQELFKELRITSHSTKSL
jgi:predicted nucleic acid-binding Zn ribbon protein